MRTDILAVNAPNAVTVGVISLGEVQSLVAITLGIVSIICTILITRQRLRASKRNHRNE